eukprot:5028316-Pyramimonas_sp.AAC.1
MVIKFPWLLRERALAALTANNGQPPTIASYVHVVVNALLHSDEGLQRCARYMWMLRATKRALGLNARQQWRP